MTLEVELKFSVDDLAPIRQRLEDLGAAWGPVVAQRDTYFGHPVRNFGDTDEALRLRRTDDGQVLTYKGPRAPGAVKARREIEVALDSQADSGAVLHELLEALGFQPVADVCKRRMETAIEREGHEIHVALDEVAGVGTFVEIELLASDELAAWAGETVQALAAELQLSQPEPRSYLELLLGRNGRRAE